MAERHVELRFETRDRWACGCPVTDADRQLWRHAVALEMADELAESAVRILGHFREGRSGRVAAFLDAAETDARVRALFHKPPPWIRRVQR